MKESEEPVARRDFQRSACHSVNFVRCGGCPRTEKNGMARPTFALSLPSDLRMLSVARTFVEAVCQACHLERSLVHAIVLVTGEAVSNIIRHAHRDLPEAELQIHIEIQPEGIVLCLRDQGEPFDIRAVPELPPGELRIGGRGVYLLRTLMDEIDCKPRTDSRGNTLRMVKRRPPLVRSVG